MRLDPNANGSLESVFSITQHSNGNTYIAGSTLRSPANEDIKIVRYDTLLNEVWVRTWGSADSLRDRPCKIGMGGNGHIIVLGKTKKLNGGTDIVLLCYHNSNGNLLWERRLSAPNPAQECKPGDMLGQPFAGLGMPTYITGTVNNGSNKDFITASYDGSGNLRWLKTMNDTLDSNDEALDIQYASGGVIVSGVSTRDTITRYVSVRYEELTVNPVAVIDTDSIPQYIDRQVIVWFNPAKVDTNFCADKDKIFTNLGNLIIDTGFLDKLDTLLDADGKLKTWKAHKVFKRLTPDVTYSISRRGDTIPMPQYWSCYVLHLPNGKTVNEVLDSLKTVGIEGIIEVQRNNTYIFNDAASDEEYQSDMQRSLRPSTLDASLVNSSINIESAWDIETGRSHVKIGVYDSGINFHHRAFGDGTLIGSNIIGYNYVDDLPILETNVNADLDQVSSHGTSCAGIIGAKRNDNNGGNIEGIAGIAGGNVNGSGVGEANQGVQLAAMCVGKTTGTCGNSVGGIISESDLAPAIVEGASSTALEYGFGLNVMNMSFGRPKATDEDRPIFKNALCTANRNQVTICASSGNRDNSDLYTVTDLNFPGSVNRDDWVICVGASGSNGRLKEEGINDGDLRDAVCTNDAYSSMYGRNVDVIAPGVTGLVYTARADGNRTADYKGFNGTSASAPHVAGVAGLIMSHLNSTQMVDGNVAPEDIENIIQLSASDVTVAPATVGEDAATGFGLLNATNALELIKLPHRQLKHTPEVNTTSTRTSEYIVSAPAIGAKLPNYGLSYRSLFVDIHEVIITYNHSGEITGSATLVDGWGRNSASKGMINEFTQFLGEDDFSFFGCEQIGSIDGTNAVFRTYVYEITDHYQGGSWHTVSPSQWFPTTIADANCAYTLLIEDLTATDIEKAPEDEISVRLTPNPSKDKAFLRYVLPEDVSALRIDVYDISGKIIRNIYNGAQDKGIYSRELNVTDLASGLYFVHLYSEEFSVTKKFTKQ